MSTPDELRGAFGGHADLLHDDERNAAFSRAIAIAAKNSKYPYLCVCPNPRNTHPTLHNLKP
jgi:hypothetical protein